MASRLNARLARLESSTQPQYDPAQLDRLLDRLNSLGATDPEGVNELLRSVGLTHRYPDNSGQEV